jgi:glycosyltransferase involved in cell wall biosynthesis
MTSMRIVIDLQACQGGPSERADATLALAQQLARSAGPHQVVIALSHRYPSSIAPLRLAFADLLPADAVRVFDLPPAQAGNGADQAWLDQASIDIRAAFLAAQQADLLFVPGLLGAETALDVSAPSPLFPLPPCSMPPAGAALDAAALWQAFAGQLAATKAAASAAAPARPRLAYVSPLPPEKSGIADYSAELLPQLARFYDVDVILAQPAVSDAWVNANLPLRDVAWFEAHAAGYDRVLYHFGNSPMHQHMFALLERHPGVVVLHDFYLANLLDYMHHTGHSPDINTAALFDSHGYTALLDRAAIGDTAAVWKYPSNRNLLQQAEGIIVHSELPKRLAADWYGAAMAQHWQVLPLLRGLPHDGAGSDRAAARLAARARLGIDPSLFLVCSFGLLGPTKLNEELLLAWQQSPLADDAHSRLVFVGELSGGNYGRDLPAKIAAGKGKKRIQITGFVSAEQYQTYLAACDVAVQLRRNSRGETSAAVLDCLLHGVPTVANAHGSTAELPPDVLCLLPDEVEPAALAAALLRLRDDADECARLSTAAAAYVATVHAPAEVGPQYVAAIEQFARRSPQRQYRTLLAALAASAAQVPGGVGRDALLQAAAAIGANHLPPAPRQLLVDISAMVQTDLKTGIQRVVRSVLMALIKDPPPGYRIEPVYSAGRGEAYRYARRYMQQMLLAPFDIADDAPVDVQAGDLFLGLDLMMHGTQQNAALLQRFRERGVQIYFVVYDILPVLRPSMFPFGAEPDFAAWLDTISSVSDGLLCISAAVADELAQWLALHPPKRVTPLGLGYFHLGADIDASAPSYGLPPDAEQILAQVASAPTLLMVGTVEPRKGHAQALAAFDLLWQQGVQVNLVIVGKHGWMVDQVARDLRNHPQQGKQLIWLSGVSDEMLLMLYHASAGLLAASEGEGFGLPLIEAAQHGLPIVARDLPVFREVAGEHAHYFAGLTAEELAATMRDWLDLLQKNKVPPSTGMPWLTWDASAQALLATALQSQWRHVIYPEKPLS